MAETIKTIIEWHEQTFPDVTLDGQIEKFDDEMLEFRKEKMDSPEWLEELADLVIVSAGIMRFNYAMGFNYLSVAFGKLYAYSAIYDGIDLWGAVEEKMKKNRSRVWKRQGNNYQHVEE